MTQILKQFDSVFLTYKDIRENNPDWTDRMIEDYLALKRDVNTVAEETSDALTNIENMNAVSDGFMSKLKSLIQKNTKQAQNNTQLISSFGNIKSLIQKNTKQVKNHAQKISSLDGWIGKLKSHTNKDSAHGIYVESITEPTTLTDGSTWYDPS